MHRPDSTALSAARIFLKFLRAINLASGVMLIGALPASFLFAPQFLEFFSKQPPRGCRRSPGARWSCSCCTWRSA